MAAKKPRKGILKSKSPNASSSTTTTKANTTWDEMNIISTLHPADKDYGFMKVDEPPTPYNYEYEPDKEQGVNPALLTQKLQQSSNTPVKKEMVQEDSDEDLTPEARENKQKFQSKRKSHYNEFCVAKTTSMPPEEIEIDTPTVSEVIYCGVENCPGHNPLAYEKCVVPKSKNKKSNSKRKSSK
ncbi:hypothetical protein C0J52_06951 [Blattella germanica]|nr:hypothetical protein C0J52_06951 [Blattella germanica]